MLVPISFVILMEMSSKGEVFLSTGMIARSWLRYHRSVVQCCSVYDGCNRTPSKSASTSKCLVRYVAYEHCLIRT